MNEKLNKLTKTGCSVLVTGEVGERDAAQFMRRRGFGTGVRPRVLALSHDHTDAHPEDYLPAGVTLDDALVRIVTRGAGVRSQPAAATATTPTPDTIFTFQNPVTAALNDVTSIADNPTDLRVAVDSIGRLITDYSKPEVESLINSLNCVVRAFSGNIYYHYRRPDTDPLVRDLATHADLRIELAYCRHPDNDLKYRFHHDGRTSDWLKNTPLNP